MVNTLTEFAVAAQQVEDAISRARAQQAYVREAEENLVLARKDLLASEVVLEHARETFFDAYPELRPAYPAHTGTAVAGSATVGSPGTFTPVVVDDEDAVPGPDGPGGLEFKEN